MRSMNVLVTGGSRGIGRAIAQALLQAGHRVLIVGKNAERISKTATELAGGKGKQIPNFACDIGDRADIVKLKSYCSAIEFEPGILVHSAGIFIEGSLLDSKPANYLETLNVDLISSYHLVQIFIESLRKAKGAKIILIGSTAGHEAYPVGALYGVAKWGLRGYAINLRQELMKENIGVTLISPGGTLTDLWAGEKLPHNRLLEPGDLGKLVAALLSLSEQAVVEDLIVRPMLGDMHE